MNFSCYVIFFASVDQWSDYYHDEDDVGLFNGTYDYYSPEEYDQEYRYSTTSVIVCCMGYEIVIFSCLWLMQQRLCHILGLGARFSKLPVITGPLKLFCFSFQVGVSEGLKIVQ